ncbi:hypothetical protein PHMEG_0005901 [Phytophthora megakarya]|uniref:PH domain-containing protein n=1 Tax=Phytophthora megakarya TaxID=4795 RepID=A0A225WQ25_9STRA|nr:hypothetical protein PHMEG_0005901 [Phytophthora megakarya]
MKTVSFSGAEVIEYDAAVAPVVKIGGLSRSSDAATLALESRARGLASPQHLTQQYVDELQQFLRQRGFEPMGDDLSELQMQRQVTELLNMLAWTDEEASKTESVAADLLDSATLRRAQLAKKQLQARVDEGYAFGRRFFSVATYVETLSSEELLAAATDRGLERPQLAQQQRAAVKALDRELLGLYGTAEGRPLRTLTLRQLVTEAEERGMLKGEKAKGMKGKKSKRAWADMLRPAMIAEVRAAKIKEKEEEMLREKMVQVVEQEKEKEQRHRVVALIETMIQSTQHGDCEPENDDALDCKERHKVRQYLEALVKNDPTSADSRATAPHMATSRGLPARMSSLHRRQSALNLPVQSMSEQGSSTINPIGIQAALSLTDVHDDDNTSQGKLSPTNRSFRDELSKLSTRRSSGSSRQFPLDSNPELYDTRTSILELSQHSHSSGRHLRTLSRDFVLPSVPTSSVRHENLTSLKDQFLKIKERFSPSVLPLSATMTPSSLVLQQQQIVTINNVTSATHVLSAQTLSEHENLNKEGSWELPLARVERWYREDDFFKVCITCWTMEAAAEVVSNIARVVSEWAPDTAYSAGAGSASPINPDVSLQWIGRQLWAVTVSLPLTRSGELYAEHITLAHRVNQAVTEVSKQSGSLSISSPTLPPEFMQQPESSPATYCHPTQIAQGEGIEKREVIEPRPISPFSPMEFNRSDDEESGVVKEDALATSPFSTLAVEDIEILRVQQAQMAYKIDGDDGDDATARKDDESIGQGQNYDDDEEEGCNEQVAALPMSWSMLSLSSQPSGSSEHASMQGEFPITDDDNGTDPLTHLVPEKTGWLKKKKRKQHGLRSSWQPRYFELKGNRLYYFGSEADGLPRGAVLLDHALVQRGRGDHAMVFSISSASSHRRLQVLKFSTRLTHQVLPYVSLEASVHDTCHLPCCCLCSRKSIELRVLDETEVAVTTWIAALNRASFYCKLASATAGSSSTLPAHSSSSFGSFSPLDKKRKAPFYRFRSPTATKTALASFSHSLTGKERRDMENTSTDDLRTTTARWKASYQQLGSVQYLRETDPLLWEIHPPEQITIRKKAARARTRSDYLAIFSRHAETFAQIFLPRPQPISLEQTLRDILPELFLINDTLYGGGEQQHQQTSEENSIESGGQPHQNRGLEHIFEVLDAHIQRFAAAPEERVRAVSALLQACARTISGGDSYFVVHRLLGNPNLIIRPAEARGRPIEIDVSPERPSRFLITVFSAFSFHLLDDVERFGDSNDGNGGGMTPAPLLRVRTRHIQDFDFASGTSTRWLKIDVEGRKEDGSPGGGGVGGGTLGRWGGRRQSHEGAESRIGALLDALS